MALIHATSLERWQDWQHSRHPLRRAKHSTLDAARRLRGRHEHEPERYALHSVGGEGKERILIAVDSVSPTSRASLLTALPYLRSGVDILAPAGMELPELADREAVRTELADPQALTGRGIRAVTSLGWHLGAGRLAHDWAAGHGVASTIVQHGALTPYAPPLPPESTLFAWTMEDGNFYRSNRRDVDVRVIGSQLLWQAAREGVRAPATASAQEHPDEARLVFLGQMHGAELPRRITAGAAIDLCRKEGALYRPHPMEIDVVSRTAHKAMRRAGIEFQDSSIPLATMPNPVVAVFSTGVLEAAVRGVPAWVHAPKAPVWVEEFWDRYRMSRWGGTEPTRGLDIGADEPARLLAQHVEGVA